MLLKAKGSDLAQCYRNYRDDDLEIFYSNVVNNQISPNIIFLTVHNFDCCTLRKLQTLIENDPVHIDSIESQRLLKMIMTVPYYNPHMFELDYISKLESQLETVLPAIFELLQTNSFDFIKSEDVSNFLYTCLIPFKMNGNTISKSFIDCFLLYDLHDNILQLSAKEMLLYSCLRILFLNLLGSGWDEYSNIVLKSMNRNFKLLEYYKSKRENLESQFKEDVKKINKKIEGYNQKVDYEDKFLYLPEKLPVILS